MRRPASVLAPAILLALIALSGCSTHRVDDGYPRRSRDVVVVGRDSRAPRSIGKIPPGHFPPPGQCRIWFPGRPPGHQPPPQSCGKLRGRVPRGAFILYNGGAWDSEYDWYRRERRRPGSVPRIILELLAGG